MKNESVPIVKEGIPFLAVTLIAAVAFTTGGLWPVGVVFFLITLYIAFFFRNPERLPPVGLSVVAAPADGTIIFVGDAVENEFSREEMRKVSIFMSLWDVHVNRAPVDGTVRDMRYHRGRFMAAFEEHAPEENERNHILFETAKGQRIIVVQIAGLVARRIVCYPTIGTFLLKGQRMGLIRFGSRCDIYLPKSSEVLVKTGEKVLGGETIVASLTP
ncbi:MAG: phosphatidylserine decarboxylase family protein [Deltaproteobacteria bacterium]|nr:phosphatidylserine decarboxylase family protein [Deltaproteobacteria bacterium]